MAPKLSKLKDLFTYLQTAEKEKQKDEGIVETKRLAERTAKDIYEKRQTPQNKDKWDQSVEDLKAARDKLKLSSEKVADILEMIHKETGSAKHLKLLREGINSYSTIKTVAATFLDLSLLTATVLQMKTILDKGDKATSDDYFAVVMIFIVISLSLQLSSIGILIWLAIHDMDKAKKDHYDEKEDPYLTVPGKGSDYIERWQCKCAKRGDEACVHPVLTYWTLYEKMLWMNKISSVLLIVLAVVHAILEGLGHTITTE